MPLSYRIQSGGPVECSACWSLHPRGGSQPAALPTSSSHIELTLPGPLHPGSAFPGRDAL